MAAPLCVLTATNQRISVRLEQSVPAQPCSVLAYPCSAQLPAHLVLHYEYESTYPGHPAGYDHRRTGSPAQRSAPGVCSSVSGPLASHRPSTPSQPPDVTMRPSSQSLRVNDESLCPSHQLPGRSTRSRGVHVESRPSQRPATRPQPMSREWVHLHSLDSTPPPDALSAR